MHVDRIVSRPGFALGTLDSLAISVWASEPLHRDSVEAVRLLATLGRKHPKIQLLAVLGAGCTLPKELVRDTLAKGIREVSTQFAAVAQVIEGKGFRGAALRGVLTGMGMVIRPGYPQKVFSGSLDAAAFLSRHGDQQARHIARAVAALRSDAL